MLSHNALRLDLEDFSRLLAALEAQLVAGRPVEAWQAAAIRRYWEQAVHMLVVHHDSEEGEETQPPSAIRPGNSPPAHPAHPRAGSTYFSS